MTTLVDRPDFHLEGDEGEEVWDAAWGDLLDPARVEESVALSRVRRDGMHQREINKLRHLAKTDLFFLVQILGYELVSVELHGNLCVWLVRTRDHQYRLILLPRGHYKSTIITISESIQMALPNDAGVVDYPYTLGPNVKIMIGHETRESASRFLFEITAAFTDNPLLMALFPECVPIPRKQRMNKWELELPRSARSKESTFDTIGAGGAAQGRHYNHIKLDDIIGEAARDSETVMKTAINWIDNINSLLTRPKFDGWDMIGTHWAYNDTYTHTIKMYGVDKPVSVLNNYDARDISKMDDGHLAVYGRSVIEGDERIFPEEFPWEFIEILRKNPMVFAAQYANNPKLAGLTELDEDWLKFYKIDRDRERLQFEDIEGKKSINWWDLQRMILLDPSMGETELADPIGLIVCGVSDAFDIFLLQTIKKRLIPPVLVDKLFELNALWHLSFVAIEEVNFSAIYRYWLERSAAELGTHIRVKQYKPGSKRKKTARVRGLSNYFSAGQIYIQERMHEFRDEYEKFPMDPGNMHLLDALAQGPEVWTPGSSRDDEEVRQQEELQIARRRSSRTGY